MEVHTLFLALLLCTSSAAGELSSLSSTSSDGDKDFIKTSCRATLHPDVCEKSLLVLAPSVGRSPRKLAHVAVSLSLDWAQAASTYLSGLSSSDKAEKTDDGAPLSDCVENMRDSVDLLRQSLGELDRMGRTETARFKLHVGNAQTWVSAALTNAGTCLDGLSNAQVDAKVVAGVQEKVSNVSQATSNALAFINHISS